MQTVYIVLIAAGALLFAVAAALLVFYFRLPRLFAEKLSSAFDNKDTKKPADYETYAARVRTVKNVKYSSPLPNSVYDIYLPREKAGPLPVIFWIHGGGFTAGSKDGTETLCTLLGAHGYAVVSADYAYAPQYKFPAVARQIADAVRSLSSPEGYDLDLSRVVIGGDSAGGHYCAQYAAAHTNPAYAAALSVKPAGNVRLAGVVLCCAPLDIATMLPPVNFKYKLLANTFFNGYFGFSPRRKRRGKALSDIGRFVTEKFPPAFLTDGNTFSFEKQNRAFGRRLAECGVKTREIYFDKEKRGVVNHEYLFELDTPLAMEGFRLLLGFLEEL